MFVVDIDDIALQRIPDDDVLKELSQQVGNCAIQLGVELGLSMVEIEQTLFLCIQRTYFVKLLMFWKSGNIQEKLSQQFAFWWEQFKPVIQEDLCF